MIRYDFVQLASGQLLYRFQQDRVELPRRDPGARRRPVAYFRDGPQRVVERWILKCADVGEVTDAGE